MIYNDPTNGQGLVQDCDYLVDTDINTYPITDKTRNANFALDEASAIILASDGTWKWDDTNYTDLPIGTATLITSQTDYTFADELLLLEAVEIKSGNDWIKLDPIMLYPGYNEIANGEITDFMSTPGIPQYYNKVGSSIFLYPAPNYTLAGGLKVYFKRKGSYFLTTDTTKQPGFASHLHRFISLSMAYDYALAKSHPKLQWLEMKRKEFMLKLGEFYSIRNDDEPKRFSILAQDNR